MSTPSEPTRKKSEPSIPEDDSASQFLSTTSTTDSTDANSYMEPLTPGYLSSAPGSPPLLSRNNSSYFSRDDMIDETPPDRLTIFDVFDNLALPNRLEKWQLALSAQKDRLAKQQQKIRSQGTSARDKAVAEWRKRVPTADERLAKYRRRMKTSLDNVNKRWTETVTITTREKISFMSAVFNIFISGYLIGVMPQRFYWWFTIQFAYFMPIRFYTYHRKGYHYFLADLCYFVNALSKRLFISTYCLTYGNNAVAIVMWRNSLVFHSFDKVTSLFIHLMPPVVLHCLVHLTPPDLLHDRFPAIFNIKYSPPGSPEHYSLLAMLTWATLPYALWQLSYHFLITVRRRDQIAAGRPTSFTWLRKSYAKTWIGKIVLALPDALQEPAFMFIQYSYACLTIIPCPIWFWYRWASAGFLLFVFGWSVWNGANYYMDVFGKKFQKELEQMKKEMARMQNSPGMTPAADPIVDKEGEKDVDKIPMLDEEKKKKEGIIKDEKNGPPADDHPADTAGAIMESVEKLLDST
ncbi:hypothetical protein LTR51_004153 [Lithohypha guttulata]|uniref:Glycerophosphocholine acyltransferase 1 n=1 Tax=Lithohypha guttulata TaxID=1690604 RepID=A0AAN7TD98_9EURO|nr:hypothetical protein LTR51_004153 [Lithohypha guttulata]KAK5090761.1 hypothetical protein LTR05_000937 [Lithohypha guttulata]